MIVSETPKRPNSRWLQVCVLLCAVVVLPLGIASAADYEAVGKRLRAAVAAGELTPEEARVMLGALRRTSQPDERQRSTRGDKRAEYEGFARRIRAAVAEGKMTPEEGREQLEGFRRRMATAERGEWAERGDGRREYEGFERRIKAAVAEGKMTREEAAEQLAGFRRRMDMAERGERERGERSITVEEYRRAEAKMRKMVEDGKAKPEDVERRLIEMRKMMAEQGERGERRISREDYGRAVGEIRKAIAEGKITEEQGRAKLGAMRKMIGEKGEDAAREGTDWEGIKNRIEGAVKSGDMTRAEADAKYKAIKERMAGRR